ncbi:MAG TPA: fatty acid desaturase [Burkholderiales bacterium]|nr:fatty acid desaturase [Burkholderiales bacterium]
MLQGDMPHALRQSPAARFPSAPEAGQGPARDAPAWLAEARGLVADLFRRSPALYWTDLLLSAMGAWACAAVFLVAPGWSATQLAAYAAAIVLFFRAGTFIHELVHMPRDEMPWFGRVWNLLVGIPLLMPWILYRNHVDHHNIRHFGTPRDGEYLPLAASPLRETLKYLAQAPLLPLFMAVRLGVLGPVSWLHRGLREWVLTRASAAVSNPHYARRFPRRDEAHLFIVEALSAAWLAALATLLLTGLIAPVHLLKGYLLLAGALSLNWIRNLAAHGYANRGGQVSHVGQMSDSINITGQTWLTALLFPVGLRYHALHHLFPSLPYHNLGEAHRRLTERLPREAPYHGTARTSFFAAVAELWRSAAATPAERSAMQAWLRKPRPL